jgi:hypothetical protein
LPAAQEAREKTVDKRIARCYDDHSFYAKGDDREQVASQGSSPESRRPVRAGGERAGEYIPGAAR